MLHDLIFPSACWSCQMNRTKVLIGLFLIAVMGLLGGRFGLPWLVERQVAAALDAHIAGLPDSTGARYAPY